MLRQLKRIVLQPESLALIAVTLVLCLLGYHDTFGVLPAKYHGLERRLTEGALYLGTALLVSVLVLRENPLRLGLGRGDSAAWARYSLLFIGFMAVLILVVSRSDRSFAGYYPLHAPAREGGAQFLLAALGTVFYMFAWEYLFRGFLLFGLARRYGDFAVVLQMVPFALVHVGKPELEAYGSIVAGLVLGVLALRTRSMWPCFLVHAFAAVWMDVCVVYVWGGGG